MRLLHLLTIAAAAVTACLTGACSGASETDALQARCDSMQRVIDERHDRLDNLTAFLDSVSLCLDSITEQEHLLLITVDPETHRRYTRDEIRSRLTLLNDIVNRQRERIAQLSAAMNNNNADAERYRSLTNMVTYLTARLDEKESRINDLLRQINDRNRNIQELTANIGQLQEALDDVAEQNVALAETVVAQTAEMHEGYTLFGDKKRLQQLGVLSKGNLFKKSSFDAGNIDLSICDKIDTRTTTRFTLHSGNPKILTAVPRDSYHIEKTGKDTCVLVIDDVESFWSLSPVLVIQL